MKKVNFRKYLALGLFACTIPLTGCGNNNNTSSTPTPSSTTTPISSTVSPSTSSTPTPSSSTTEVDTLKAERDAANSTVESYKNKSDYKESEAEQLQTLIDTAKSKISTAATADEITAAVNEFKAAADLLKTAADYDTEALAKVKEEAKATISSYAKAENYRDAEKAALETLITKANTEIDAATTSAVVEGVVTTFKAAVDQLKTDAQYKAEELAAAKELAKTEINNYLSLSAFRSEEQETLTALINEYLGKVDAATEVSDITPLVSEYKTKASAIKTAAQYEAEELAAAKTTALETIASLVNKSDYREAEQKAIDELLATATSAINEATTIEAVNAASDMYADEVAKLKTKAEYEAEEAKALATRKKEAEDEILDYKDTVIYRQAEEDQYFDLADKYTEKLKTATTIAEVDEIVAEFKGKVDLLPVDTGFTGALENGAIVSFTAADKDIVSDVRVTPDNHDWQGDGIAFRIKNNTSMNSYIGIFINETDSDRVSLNTGGTYYTYTLDGVKKATTSGRGWGHYINLEANFDGYIYIPYKSFAIDNTYGSGNKTFNYSSVYGMYFETAVLEAYGDYNQNYTLGEFQVLSGSTIKTVLNNTKTTSANFTQKYTQDYNGDHINLAFNGEISEGNKLPFSGTLNGGVNVTFNHDTTDGLATMLVKGQTASWSGDGVILRIKNNTGESFVDFRINETDSDRAKIKVNGEFTLYDLEGNETVRSSGRDWNSYIYLPANFDGYIYIPYSILEYENGGGDGKLTFASVWGIYLGTSKQYDSYQNYTLGSVIIKNGDTYTTVLDPEKLTDSNYSQNYGKDINADYINISRYTEA